MTRTPRGGQLEGQWCEECGGTGDPRVMCGLLTSRPLPIWQELGSLLVAHSLPVSVSLLAFGRGGKGSEATQPGILLAVV